MLRFAPGRWRKLQAEATSNMTPRARQTSSREALRGAQGVLLVMREPLPAMAPIPGQPAFVASDPREGLEPLIAVWDDASVTAFHGHVDLGTVLRTALTQIVAEELDICRLY